MAKLNAPEAVGAPDKTPVTGSRVTPVGNAPALTLKLCGASPPLAVKAPGRKRITQFV
jgi:hypothetical protein